MRKVFIVLMMVMMVGGCTHNLTKLDGGVYARTTEADVGSIDSEGNMQAAYHGLGATQLSQDESGNWTNMPGPVGVLSAPMPNGGVAYIISPKDVRVARMTYTPEPAAGSPSVVLEGLEANITEPLGQHVEALRVALPILENMTREEALATVEKWRIAGTMVPEVADLLTSIIKMWAL